MTSAKAAARILVIDDDLAMREILGLHLTAAGYRVDLAEDAVEGGRKIMASPPDLLLLDVRMPYMQGDELLSLLRSEPDLRKLKVVVLTSYPETPAAKRAEGLDIVGLLPKPVQKEKLLSVVAAALAGPQSDLRR